MKNPLKRLFKTPGPERSVQPANVRKNNSYMPVRQLAPPRPRARHKAGARNYESANTSRFMNGWATMPQPINYQITSFWHTLVARSRAGYQNNDYLKRAVTLQKSKIVGHQGVRFVPKVLKRDGTLDADVNRQISRLIKDAGKKGVLEVSGQLSAIDIQNRVVHSKKVDGEFISIDRYSNEYKYGYAIQIIDPVLLPVTLNEDLPNGNRIRCGIELNKDSRPIAYHFIKERKNASYTDTQYYTSGDCVRILAKHVTHVFDLEFPGQLRGIPQCATSLFRVEMLRKYIEAELIGATMSARSPGFFIPNKDNVVPYEGKGDVSVQDPDGEVYEYEEDLPEELEADDIEPGSVQIAPLGYDFKSWDMNRPNSAFPDFVKENNRAVAASNGVNYSDLSNDYENVSFSSLRHSKITDEEIEKQQQCHLVEHFYQRFIEKLIWSAINFRKFVIKDRLVRSAEDYMEGVYIPKVAKWVDPVKTAQAFKILNKELGVMSRERIAIQLDVVDPEQEFSIINAENSKYPYYNESSSENSTDDLEDEDDESKPTQK